MTRIYGFILVALVFACQPKFEVLVEETDHLKSDELKPFYHGVASGDPLSDRVVIWTRVTPEKKLPEVEVKWEVSSDPQFAGEILSGTYTTDSARDYTLKVDVTGLSPGQIYYYRFQALGATSMAGRTKTATQEASDLQFAVVSCSNYEWGYFNAYGRIAERSDIDAVIHLGDYIYEYGPGRYGDTSSLRKNLPPKEIVSLYDYRTRYALYRLDSDLRSVHSKHPFIAVWDDHEIANDSYKDGAQNHQEDEGPYEDRRNAAVQAYYEWLPIREGDLLYRRFQFGPLADLFMLDERLEGRTAQLDSLTDPSFEDPNRSMLGTEQLSWWLDGMKQSTAHWKIIGNQVIFSYLDWGRPTFNINLDSWDGYIAEQQKVLDFIGSEELENIV
ncbi:MAG: alkaline phosphatase D family protein, partial [Cyclobacteriaceae bacterium]|nr:alkaline phosphatase D family protein [Cyclobacteriaceae bacterium HetDA_MAG_MS6]